MIHPAHQAALFSPLFPSRRAQATAGGVEGVEEGHMLLPSAGVPSHEAGRQLEWRLALDIASGVKQCRSRDGERPTTRGGCFGLLLTVEHMLS